MARGAHGRRPRRGVISPITLRGHAEASLRHSRFGLASQNLVYAPSALHPAGACRIPPRRRAPVAFALPTMSSAPRPPLPDAPRGVPAAAASDAPARAPPAAAAAPPNEPAPAGDDKPRRGTRFWLVYVALCVSLLLAALDLVRPPTLTCAVRPRALCGAR